MGSRLRFLASFSRAGRSGSTSYRPDEAAAAFQPVQLTADRAGIACHSPAKTCPSDPVLLNVKPLRIDDDVHAVVSNEDNGVVGGEGQRGQHNFYR